MNRWAAEVSPSTVRNTVNALRSLYRRALSLDMVPAVRGSRDRVASSSEAAELLAALEVADRALWGVAMYAGLRRGELLALRWGDIDLDGGVLAVRRAWDPRARVFVGPKSAAGTRVVPVAAVLRAVVVAHKLASADTSEQALVFPGRRGLPMAPHTITNRAAKAWAAENRVRAERDALVPIGLHESRHTFASLMIAADVNVKQLSVWMGHSSIVITLDRYGHLLPGAEADGAAAMDRYLAAAT